MNKIKPVKTSNNEYEMWNNIIDKVNELVEAVNKMIPFTTGEDVEDNK
jgi:hypothetical protein